MCAMTGLPQVSEKSGNFRNSYETQREFSTPYWITSTIRWKICFIMLIRKYSFWNTIRTKTTLSIHIAPESMVRQVWHRSREKVNKELQRLPSFHGGADTNPAGPWPKGCPPTVLSSALKPSSSTGMPNCFIFDWYVSSRSLWA